MEVVLEAVELGTTNPFQYFDEMVLLLYILYLFSIQFLVRSGDDHDVLAASVFKARTDEYVCDSNLDDDRSFVLLLGNDGNIFNSKYYKLCAEDNIYELLYPPLYQHLAACESIFYDVQTTTWKRRPLSTFESSFDF